MIALIDNFDSFTYNVYQFLCQLTKEEVRVFRNNEITLEELKKLDPSAVIISPGPGRPEDGGISLDTIKYYAGKKPLLGICLGHQSIGQAFGAKIVQAKEIVHGKTEEMTHDGKGLFRGISDNSVFTRYHSLAIEESTLPKEFEVTARSADGTIMGIRHKTELIEGVQFHPESIGSEEGMRLLKNFLHYKLKPFNKKATLTKLTEGKALTESEAADFMDELTEGDISDVYAASVLSAMSARGIEPQEVAGCASVLARKKSSVKVSQPVIDTCGTGGDGKDTFNISSFSALLAASAGAYIAKHGNRGVSSKSGSSNFYEELGLNLMLKPEEAGKQIDDKGFAFLFAPLYHSSMKYAAPVRKEMGVRTIMNLIGPLSNPAEADYQLIGVYSEELLPLMAKAAKLRGVKRVMVVHSKDGLDEISPSAPTKIFRIDEDGNESEEIFDPLSIGISGIKIEDLTGGDASENVQLAKDLLDNKGRSAIKEACCLNAGAALMLYGKASTIEDGYKLAKASLESGKAKEYIETLIVNKGN